MERVSIFNCVSTALEMLRFSTDAIYENAGTDNFDYIIVTWLPSKEVTDYLNDLKTRKPVHIVEYQTNPSVGYVPNLRGMMNTGFDYGFKLNNYCGLTNTDQYFGKNWLINLMKYANENDIVNSVSIGPINIGPHIIVSNLGIPEYKKFNMAEFNRIYEREYRDVLETEEQRGGWVATNTMPYVIPKKFWEKCGPWDLTITVDTPDRLFFKRCHDAGARFTMSRGSIVYHYEAVERTGKRPQGAEQMRNE
jgi:hypothetical protein